MQKIYIIGNLTNNPDKRATNTGLTVCSFSVAVNRRYRSTTGEKVTDFFRVKVWHGLADVCAISLKKGSKVAVIGELQPGTYETKDGKTRMSLDIAADEVEFLDRKEKDEEA